MLRLQFDTAAISGRTGRSRSTGVRHKLIALAALLLLPGSAFAIDIQVASLNPTSLSEVSYRVGTITYTETDATIPVVFSLSAGSHVLYTSFGQSTFNLDAVGNITVTSNPATNLPVMAVGNTITLRNTVSFPTLTVVATNPTTVSNVTYRLAVYANNSQIGDVEVRSGADIQAGVAFPFEGMAPNQLFGLGTTLGTVYFTLDDAGAMVTHSAGTLPHTLAGSTITLLNTVSFPTLTVVATNPTTVSNVTYRLAVYTNNSQIGDVEVRPGADIQAGVAFPFEGMAPNQLFGLGTTLGTVYFTLDDAGAMVTHSAGTLPHTLAGSTITLLNTVSFPTLTVVATNPTTVSNVTYRLAVYTNNSQIGDVEVRPGADIQAGVAFPFEGMAPNQLFGLGTTLGTVYFTLDDAGAMVPHSAGTLPHTLAGSTITLLNTVSFPTLTVVATNPTTVSNVTYRLAVYTNNSQIGDVEVRPGADIQAGVAFPFEGMAPNQLFGLGTTLGTVYFTLDDAGAMVPHSAGTLPHTLAGSTITLLNTVSFPTLTVVATNPTTVSNVTYRLAVYTNNSQIGDVEVRPGADIQAGVAFPFEGMAPNQLFGLGTTLGTVYFTLDDAGAMVTHSAGTLPHTLAGSTITLQNILEAELLVTAAVNSPVPTLDYRLYASGNIVVDVVKTLAGSEIQEGTDFVMNGMAANQSFTLVTTLGHVLFKFLPDGTVQFFAPAVQLTATSGSLDIECNAGDCANVLYLDLLFEGDLPDMDDDGIPDLADNCPTVPNENQSDVDEDTIGDVCDICPDDAANDADFDNVCESNDNCPTDTNEDQLDSDTDGLGDVCDACPSDPHNDADGDGVCGDIDAEVAFRKAKIYFNDGKIKVEGNLSLPPGYWTDNLDPIGSVTLALADSVVTDQAFGLEIKGHANKKWEYEDKDLEFGNVRKLQVDWKGSKFEFQDGNELKLKTSFIGGAESTLRIETHDVSGAFTVTVADTVIAYDADRNIVANVDWEADKPDNKKVDFTLPYQLLTDMTVQVSGAQSHTILVADHFDLGTIKFKLETRFDPALYPLAGDTLPQSLVYLMSLGDTVYGYGLIDTMDWDEIKVHEWKY